LNGNVPTTIEERLLYASIALD
jgi:hypothetical protein